MPLLPDISVGALEGQDPAEQIKALVKQLNEWGRLLSNEDRVKITKDDAGVQRMLQGYHRGGFANGDVGVKVSQTGVDVTQATDDQLIWSTDFNSFKIVDRGTVTIGDLSISSGGSNNNSQSVTVQHNLGFRPIVLAFSDFSASSRFWAPSNSFESGAVTTSGANLTGIMFYAKNIIITDTEVTFSHKLEEATQAVATRNYSMAAQEIRYYLLREAAN